jgi:hypothetical protein
MRLLTRVLAELKAGSNREGDDISLSISACRIRVRGLLHELDIEASQCANMGWRVRKEPGSALAGHGKDPAADASQRQRPLLAIVLAVALLPFAAPSDAGRLKCAFDLRPRAGTAMAQQGAAPLPRHGRQRSPKN